jgi:hypothetical protein
VIIQREYGIDILSELKPLFTEDGGYDKETCFNELSWQLLSDNGNDKVCIITARDGKELKGFLVANIVYDRVYLNQAYSILSLELAFKGMELLKEWGRQLGMKELRFNTEHGSTVFRAVRNWGFDIISVEMGCKL